MFWTYSIQLQYGFTLRSCSLQFFTRLTPGDPVLDEITSNSTSGSDDQALVWRWETNAFEEQSAQAHDWWGGHERH